MPKVTTQQLEDMRELLQSGPLIIGEDHTLKLGRQAIKKLLRMSAIRFLSLETPVGPESILNPQNNSVGEAFFDRYFSEQLTLNSSITLKDLARYAAADGFDGKQGKYDAGAKQAVPVYFHDAPHQRNNVAFAGLAGDDRYDPDKMRTSKQAYLQQAVAFLPVGVSKLPVTDTPLATVPWVVIRNHFAKNALTHMLGANPGQLIGLLILAGNDHMSATVCGNGTLQQVLGIPQDRVYDFSQ
ncbi:hypothetical protein ACVW0Y_003067 [Pseudomonas sp. TE3786]